MKHILLMSLHWGLVWVDWHCESDWTCWNYSVKLLASIVNSPASVYPACLVSDILSYPQIILFGSAFSTSLISYMVATSRAANPSAPSFHHYTITPMLSRTACFEVICWPSFWPSANSPNHLWKGLISRWHVIYHTWPLDPTSQCK